MSYTTFNASKAVATNRVVVTGAVVRATTAAVVNLRDGDNTGPVVIPIAVAANDTFTTGVSVPFNSGLYVEVVSGNVDGTVIYS
jgi:hypothetical protein